METVMALLDERLEEIRSLLEDMGIDLPSITLMARNQTEGGFLLLMTNEDPVDCLEFLHKTIEDGCELVVRRYKSQEADEQSDEYRWN